MSLRFAPYSRRSGENRGVNSTVYPGHGGDAYLLGKSDIARRLAEGSSALALSVEAIMTRH